MSKQTPESIRAFEGLLWAAYEGMQGPILIIRGMQSDLLMADTARDMLQRNHRASLLEVPDVGHAPTLRSKDQIDPIERFLLT